MREHGITSISIIHLRSRLRRRDFCQYSTNSTEIMINPPTWSRHSKGKTLTIINPLILLSHGIKQFILFRLKYFQRQIFFRYVGRYFLVCVCFFVSFSENLKLRCTFFEIEIASLITEIRNIISENKRRTISRIKHDESASEYRNTAFN